MSRNTSGLKRGGPGRKLGIPNRASQEIKDAAKAIVEDPAYVSALKQRVIRGKAPHMETLLFHYAYGKPKETVGLEGGNGGPIILTWQS